MKARVEGKFLGVEPYEFTPQGSQTTYKGFTMVILQGMETSRLSIREADAPAEWPNEQDEVSVLCDIRQGFEGKGFKAAVLGIDTPAKAGR